MCDLSFTCFVLGVLHRFGAAPPPIVQVDETEGNIFAANILCIKQTPKY